MKTHASESREGGSRAAANAHSERQGNGKSDFHIANNRPEDAQIAGIQEMANNCLQSRNAAQLQSMVDRSPRMMAQGRGIGRNFGKAAQLHASEAEELQMKTADTPLQRKGVHGEDEFMKARTTPIQKQGMGDEEPLQGRFEPFRKRANNTGLPDNLRSGIENLSGHSMDDVKVHYNSAKPAQLQAAAYTQGSDIFVGPGQEKHLCHEAWHVVQQKQGRVKPSMQLKDGVNINNDSGLEREADLMGTKALGMSAKLEVFGKPRVVSAPNWAAPIQLKADVELVRRTPVTPIGGNWGLTIPEDIVLDFSPTRNSGQWEMDISKITGRYSQQVRLLPGVTEVTGPSGNSNAGNYANQIQDLRALGNPPGGAAWYMLKAVQDHEDVHKSQFLPALSTRTVKMEEQFNGLTAPGHLNRTNAKQHIQNLPGFALASTAAFNQWINEAARRITDDHRPGGRTDSAERRVVNPMIRTINDEAMKSGWGPKV